MTDPAREALGTVREGLSDTKHPELGIDHLSDREREALAALDTLADALERAQAREKDWAASVEQEQSHLHHCRAALERVERERQWLLDREKHHESKAEAVVEAARDHLLFSSCAAQDLRDALTAYDEPPTVSERGAHVPGAATAQAASPGSGRVNENPGQSPRSETVDEPPTKINWPDPASPLETTPPSEWGKSP